MSKADFRDGRHVKREMDIQLISAATVESLYQMIGIDQGEPGQAFENKLNEMRIEVQG
jgi:hypothetical protein